MGPLTEDSPSVHTQYQSISGKKILVTGGTTGIGRAITELLVAQGAQVFVFGRHESELRQTTSALTSASGKVSGITADQSRPEDIARVFAALDREFGQLDVLVNNAGMSSGAITEGSDDEWRYQLATNLTGHIDCVRHAVERMKRQGKGHIVDIGSISAVHVNKDLSLYVAAKAGIEGYSRSLRKELASEGIKVSQIEPGPVGTEIWDGEERGDAKVQHDEQSRGEMLKAEDVAVAVHYILTQPERCNVSLIRLQPAQSD